MHPSRAAKIAATIGAVLLLVALALRLISIGYTTSTLGMLAPPPEPELPQVGGYHLAADGTEIRFRQGDPESSVNPAVWYSMTIEGGAITQTDGPETPVRLEPFVISEGVLYRQGPSENSRTRMSPSGETVTEAALSPDGDALAFITQMEGGERHRLYVLHAGEGLLWLDEEASFFHLDWSPDSTKLAFIAYQGSFTQLFVTGERGEDYRPLTSDPSRKRRPAWSPDGTQIAYLAFDPAADVPDDDPMGQETDPPDGQEAVAAAQYDVMLIDAGGDPSSVRRLAQVAPFLFRLGLDWITAADQPEVIYPVPLPDHPETIYLYAVSPMGGEPRRVYPPVMIEALECPPAFPVERAASARLTLSNSALVPVDLPLVLRAQHLPFTIRDLFETAVARAAAFLQRGGEESANAPVGGAASERVETVTLLPGEERVVEWPEQAVAGARVTRLFALPGEEQPYPIPGQTCTATNTSFGVPNMPFLGPTLPLVALGMLLCLPQLLRWKNGKLWALWAAVPFLFFMLFLFEASINYGG